MIADENTFRPEGEKVVQPSLKQEPESLSQPAPSAAAAERLAAQGVACPYCGTVNDSEALFCASCGNPLRMGTCPNCHSEIEPDADYCEVCHHYIKTDICAFCGARLLGGDFCPECGNPRGGIVCPVCNTLNDFSFCKKCGAPLTVEATELVQSLKQQPEYQQLSEAVKELDELNKQLPFMTERDVVNNQMNDRLRERVLTLLAQDKGVPDPVIPKRESKRMPIEDLTKLKQEKMQLISDLLGRMELPPQPTPAKARNYAMAQKPLGVRLAWVCNFKHALHSSPCGCAKPQKGGRWVVLGKDSMQEIKDDK